MTIKEFLIGQFGDSARRVVGIDNEALGGREATDFELLINAEGLLTYAGGLGCPLINFGSVVLYYDDLAEQAWLSKLAAMGDKSIGPRPSARLRLIRQGRK